MTGVQTCALPILTFLFWVFETKKCWFWYIFLTSYLWSSGAICGFRFSTPFIYLYIVHYNLGKLLSSILSLTDTTNMTTPSLFQATNTELAKFSPITCYITNQKVIIHLLDENNNGKYTTICFIWNYMSILLFSWLLSKICIILSKYNSKEYKNIL